MLIQFRFSNFKSFNREQCFSFVKGKVGSRKEKSELAKNIIGTKQSCGDLLKSAAIYGANASGKSNFIEAIDFMRKQVVYSLRNKPGASFNLDRFRLDSKSLKKPAFFEVSLVLDKIIYVYGFEINEKEVVSEQLFYYPKGQPKRVFEREKTGVKLGGDLPKKSFNQIAEKLDKNTLFISLAAKWENEILSKVYQWFSEKLKIVKRDVHYNYTAKLTLEDKDNKDSIIQLLKNADIGIKDILVRERKEDEIKFGEKSPLPEKVKEIIREQEKFEVKFVHSGSPNDVEFVFEQESTGTQAFFGFLGPLLDIIENVRCVFIDEIQRDIHPILVEKLLKYFNNKSNKAQIATTTHNTNLLSGDIFRRDQIWFVQKENDGASFIYPLADYKPREGEALEKGYLMGRYGAVPVIDELDSEG
jgi:hypothetical protein